MKVNFAAIHIQGIEREETLDLRKQIGNYLYYQSQDLAGSELGKRVYFSSASEGLEITDDERKLLSDAADVQILRKTADGRKMFPRRDLPVCDRAAEKTVKLLVKRFSGRFIQIQIIQKHIFFLPWRRTVSGSKNCPDKNN